MSGPRYQTSPKPRGTQQRGTGGADSAMVADKAREYYDKQAKERQKRKPVDSVVENLPQQTHERARDAAGKALGVSGRSVDERVSNGPSNRFDVLLLVLATGSNRTVATMPRLPGPPCRAIRPAAGREVLHETARAARETRRRPGV